MLSTARKVVSVFRVAAVPFDPGSVPVAMLLATIYLYYVSCQHELGALGADSVGQLDTGQCLKTCGCLGFAVGHTSHTHTYSGVCK